MKTKIKIKNAGPLEAGRITLNDLTILCGYNNTGKTQVARQIYSFLRDSRSEGKTEINPIVCDSLYQTSAAKIDMEDIADKRSSVIEEHAGILENFEKIIGGRLSFDGSGGVEYTPDYNKAISIPWSQSSGAVRSLIGLWLYLQCFASPGDLLILDGPEKGLHIKNQMLLARLFAQLVNAGVKVFITTHSDFIIRELEILTMFSKKMDQAKVIAEREGYCESEIIGAEKIVIYSIRKSLFGDMTIFQEAEDPRKWNFVGGMNYHISCMRKVQEALRFGCPAVLRSQDKVGG